MRGRVKASSAASIRAVEGSGALALALLILLGAFLAFSAPAPAATTYRQTAAFSPEGNGWGRVAVDDSTGNVLVLADSAVRVFAPGGASESPIAEFGAETNPFFQAIAVDQATGAVYVTDANNSRIVRYLSNGASPPVYTPDPTFTSPAYGTDPSSPKAAEEIGGFYGSVLAVDPTNGDLLFGDPEKDRVSRFTSSGAFVRNFDGAGSASGAFHRILDLTVADTGAIYVVDLVEGELPFGGTSDIARFAADGTPDNSFDPEIEKPAAAVFDSKAGNLVVVGNPADMFDTPNPLRVTVLQDDKTVHAFEYPRETIGVAPAGLASDGRASGQLYLATRSPYGFGTADVRVYDLLTFPDIAFNPPTAVTATTAQVSGSVDPLGIETSYRFEYSFDGEIWDSNEPQPITGPGPQPVSAELTGLAGNTTYSVRLTVTTPGGEFFTKSEKMVTSASGPGVVTGRATDRTTTSATLNGTVNPYGLQSTYYLEYGLTSAYGSRLPVAHENVVSDGRRRVPVFKVVTGLAPETTYHYRFVATNAVGTVAGPARAFTTKSAARAPRFYEQISPVDKDGTNIDAGRGVQSSLDGEQVFYSSKSPIGGKGFESEGGPLISFTSSWRGDGIGDWSAMGVDPLVVSNPQPTRFVSTFGAAADGSKVVVASLKGMAPGAVDGDSNLYLRDSATGAYTTLISVPGPNFYVNSIGLYLGNTPFIGGTPSFDTVIFQSKFSEELVPGTPGGALFAWTDGEVRLASVGPGGEALSAMGRAISDDGSKIIFESAGALYVRLDGARTLAIPGTYAGSSDDRSAIFTTGIGLTPDSEPGVISLYRYDVADEELELLTEMGANGEVLSVRANEIAVYQVSGDGRTVFFSSENELVGEGVAGRTNIYVWRDGTVSHIATLEHEEKFPRAQTSPNGRYLAMVTFSRLTDYDNSTNACAKFNDIEGRDPDSCREIYRYEVATDELLCASCRPDGGRPTGSAQMRPAEGKIDFGPPHLPRQMLDNGEVLFDTPDPLAARDTNGVRDVYSFDGEEATLVTSGKGSGGSQFGDASPSGRDVFFTTTDRLVGQDTDSLADLYDARIGGGIASQNPPPPRADCIRDDCKATPNAGPELPFGGSEALSGPGNVPAAKKGRCGKNRQVKKRQGKVRCVKRKQHKAKAKPKTTAKTRNANGRQGR